MMMLRSRTQKASSLHAYRPARVLEDCVGVSGSPGRGGVAGEYLLSIRRCLEAKNLSISDFTVSISSDQIRLRPRSRRDPGWHLPYTSALRRFSARLGEGGRDLVVAGPGGASKTLSLAQSAELCICILVMATITWMCFARL